MKVYSTSGAAHLALGFGVPAVWRDCTLHRTLDGTGWAFKSRETLRAAIRAASEWSRMYTVRFDEELPHVTRLANIGQVCARAEETAWPRVAERHLEIYREVV